jgi:hypothetical protein
LVPRPKEPIENLGVRGYRLWRSIVGFNGTETLTTWRYEPVQDAPDTGNAALLDQAGPRSDLLLTGRSEDDVDRDGAALLDLLVDQDTIAAVDPAAGTTSPDFSAFDVEARHVWPTLIDMQAHPDKGLYLGPWWSQMMPISPCRLCGATKELQESQILPGFVFRWMKETFRDRLSALRATAQSPCSGRRQAAFIVPGL